jgi:hypothetical protein
MAAWEIVRPLFEALYEASPVWVWAKQRAGKKIQMVKAKAAFKVFILDSP